MLTAGEPERARRRTRLETGIPIDDKSWTDILVTANDAGVRLADRL